MSQRLVLGLVGLLFIVILQACTTEERVGNKELAREIKNNKIKRITNTQLVSTVDEWGKTLVSIADKAVTNAIEKNPENATSICAKVEQLPVIAALHQEYGVAFRLLSSADLTNPSLTPKERELLDAYLYNAENNLPQSDNVQTLNDTLLVYNAPLAPTHVICQKCFSGQQIPLVVWSIRFNKREVINKIDVKKLQ
jgi:hypothetical protein